MATKHVVKTVSSASSQVGGFQRARYERSEVAYGTVTGSDYTIGDTLVFSEIPMKDLIHARLVAAGGQVLEVFNGTDISSPLVWDTDTAQTFSYVISYIRGTGKIDDASAETGEGKLLKVTVVASV